MRWTSTAKLYCAIGVACAACASAGCDNAERRPGARLLDPPSRGASVPAPSGRLGPGAPSVSPPSPPAAPPAAPLVIGNRTPHAIAEVHVAAVAERSWEPNLLASALPPGADAVADRPACAHYDVLVVKGDGMRCVLANTALCFADEPWRIHDVTLDTCRWQR